MKNCFLECCVRRSAMRFGIWENWKGKIVSQILKSKIFSRVCEKNFYECIRFTFLGDFGMCLVFPIDNFVGCSIDQLGDRFEEYFGDHIMNGRSNKVSGVNVNTLAKIIEFLLEVQLQLLFLFQ